MMRALVSLELVRHPLGLRHEVAVTARALCQVGVDPDRKEAVPGAVGVDENRIPPFEIRRHRVAAVGGEDFGSQLVSGQLVGRERDGFDVAVFAPVEIEEVVVPRRPEDGRLAPAAAHLLTGA